MVEVCEGAPVAVGGWVLPDRHDLASCAANGLHRVTVSLVCVCVLLLLLALRPRGCTRGLFRSLRSTVAAVYTNNSIMVLRLATELN